MGIGVAPQHQDVKFIHYVKSSVLLRTAHKTQHKNDASEEEEEEEEAGGLSGGSRGRWMPWPSERS